MAQVSYLLDTDILVDWLHGRPWTKELLRAKNTNLYCSSVTRKELLSKPGLRDRERRRVLSLMRHIRVLVVDQGIAAATSELLAKYASHSLQVEDALIAATAWQKKLPLFTRNRKHYEFIAEITLADLP